MSAEMSSPDRTGHHGDHQAAANVLYIIACGGGQPAIFRSSSGTPRNMEWDVCVIATPSGDEVP